MLRATNLVHGRVVAAEARFGDCGSGAGVIDEAFVGGAGGDERGDGEVVDTAWFAAAGVVDEGDRVVGCRRGLGGPSSAHVTHHNPAVLTQRVAQHPHAAILSPGQGGMLWEVPETTTLLPAAICCMIAVFKSVTPWSIDVFSGRLWMPVNGANCSGVYRACGVYPG